MASPLVLELCIKWGQYFIDIIEKVLIFDEGQYFIDMDYFCKITLGMCHYSMRIMMQGFYSFWVVFR